MADTQPSVKQPRNTPRSKSVVFWNSIPLSEKDSGVYAISNNSNGRIYIGSSFNLAGRKRIHRCKLAKGRHDTFALQEDFNSDPSSLEFVLVEKMSGKTRDEIFKREQFWMTFYDACNPITGYNTNLNPLTGKGVKRRPEIIERITEGCRKKINPKKTTRSVVQMSLSGDYISRYDSLRIAAKAIGKPNGMSGICWASSGKIKTAFGFKWRYE
jgi:hypothetical protein